MEKFDKNYIIGFVLLFLMYGSYMYFYPAVPKELPATETSQETQNANTNSNAIASTPVVLDSAAAQAQYGSFASAVNGEAKDVVLENTELKVTISSKGGVIKEVALKNHKTYDDFDKGIDAPMVIIDESNSDIDLEITTPSGKVNLSDLYFTVSSQSASAAVLELKLADGKTVRHSYSLPESGYALDYDLAFDGTAGLINNEAVNFKWENKLKRLENDLEENRKAAQVNYYETDGDFEDVGLNSTSDEAEQAESPISWFSFKQKYFTSGFVSKNEGLDNLSISLLTPKNDTTIVKDATVSALIPISALTSGKGNFRYYFGPNTTKDLNTVADGFSQNLYLGYDIIKPINKYVFVPLFNWLEQFFTNYGFLIIVVVLIIKLTLTPLLYKSYTSSAKMKILAPEIAEIKEKVGDDSVKVQQETMKLYQQVGVSPLSGCIPMLLQMPILMSVFFLFPNMEMFRQKGFLWAKDLSTYDAPLSWATDLPVIGNHLSLFVVLMTISSLAFTYYNNQITPAQPGPVDMKKISYIFPLVFFFVLNSFPAALSFYYLVSNLVTIAQQLTVKRFIDEDKIKAVLEENKKNYATKPKKKNKFANYMQKQLQAQEEANKVKAQELKKRKNKGK
ncbi:membrane protein insertase YidC [uncultured Arcticibacterium sp.]|uniref:membrane protein insertase YidC n=1 Tax=uncultured Arcticibacterium sp. TaxID=2173042 RepID=UPI0030FC77BE